MAQNYSETEIIHVFDLLGNGLSERPWDSKIDTGTMGQVPIVYVLSDQHFDSFHVQSGT
jgi:hypothetical protein